VHPVCFQGLHQVGRIFEQNRALVRLDYGSYFFDQVFIVAIGQIMAPDQDYRNQRGLQNGLELAQKCGAGGSAMRKNIIGGCQIDLHVYVSIT